MNDEIKQDGPSEGITSPGKETHEATTPPGNGDPDTEAGKKVEEQLEKAGGGH
jgi:hypothetical protein